MEQQQQNKIAFTVTGFGPFGSVIDNPTSILINSLTESEKIDLNIVSSSVLEVSMQGVNDHVANVNPSTIVSVHFGVYQAAQSIILEQKAYNNQNSCYPPDAVVNYDEPQCIDQNSQYDSSLSSTLDLVTIHNELQAQHKDVFSLGEDPGRYMCNYIYYRSIQTFQNSTAPGQGQKYSLFVHCPAFETIPFETQKASIFSLLKEIRKNLISKLN